MQSPRPVGPRGEEAVDGSVWAKLSGPPHKILHNGLQPRRNIDWSISATEVYCEPRAIPTGYVDVRVVIALDERSGPFPTLVQGRVISRCSPCSCQIDPEWTLEELKAHLRQRLKVELATLFF